MARTIIGELRVNLTDGVSGEAKKVAASLRATHSTATRLNIEASLARLAVAGVFVREDLNVTGASPVYRRVL